MIGEKLTYFQSALSTVSFLMVIGLLVDRLRRTDLSNLYVSITVAGELGWGRTSLRQLDKSISAILGDPILSLRSILLVFAWSVPINSLIWISDVYRSNSEFENTWYVVAIVFFNSTIWSVLVSFIHDYFSVVVTRLLLKRAITTNHLMFLAMDVLVAYVLLNSAYGLQKSALIAFKFGHIHPNAVAMLWKYWWHVIFSSLELSPIVPSSAWHYAALLCAISALVPTLYYIAVLVTMVVARVFGMTAYLLEYLQKGSDDRYTVFFAIISVSLVLVSLLLDVLL